jgi:hypothetical protein
VFCYKNGSVVKNIFDLSLKSKTYYLNQEVKGKLLYHSQHIYHKEGKING